MAKPRLSDLHSCRTSITFMRQYFAHHHEDDGVAPVEASTLPPPTRDDGADLPLVQQYALLSMLPSTLARGVVKQLAAGQDRPIKPTIVDYHHLRERGYAIRHAGEQYHELTPAGVTAAKRLLQSTCRTLNIHVMQEEPAGDQTRYRCSCGGWSRTFNGNGQFTWRRAVNAFHSHHNLLAMSVAEWARRKAAQAGSSP